MIPTDGPPRRRTRARWVGRAIAWCDWLGDAALVCLGLNFVVAMLCLGVAVGQASGWPLALIGVGAAVLCAVPTWCMARDWWGKLPWGRRAKAVAEIRRPRADPHP